MPTHELRFIFRGQPVEATVTYSSKDYSVQIHKPVEAKLPGKHIMAMLPAVYVIEKQPNMTHNQVPLKERCEKEIREFLQNL